MHKQDSAISVVIIFVMVLAVLAVVISVWALIGVPGQVKEINYHHSFSVENGLADFQSMMFSAFNSDRSVRDEDGVLKYGQTDLIDAVNTMLIPVGWTSYAGKLQLKHDVGTFKGIGRHVSTTASGGYEFGDYKDEYEISIDRLSVSLGKDIEIGLEGGGVYRRDGNSAQWIVRPFFDTINKYDYALTATRFTDTSSLEKTTNGDLSLNAWYTGEYDEIHGGALTYTSSEQWDIELWYDFFYEVSKGESTLVSTIPDPYEKGDTYFTVNLRKGMRSPVFGVELAMAA